MNDKQPDALRLADRLEGHSTMATRDEAAALLRTQHAEIERLTLVLDDTLARSVVIFERKDALLKQALTYLEESRTLEPINLDWVKGSRRAVAAAIKQELAK